MVYRITFKPNTSGNTISNEVLERIHQVLGNIVWTYNITQTYVGEDWPWLGVLAAAEFSTHSTTNRLKGYIQSQLLFRRDMIILIKHKVYWKLIHQQNKTQINKDHIS